ncbi:hypothetical protein TNCV_2806331 [Trichonephila clavipes]|nr:hypothetical protein TNCV_2806331 [Trichonephila clavipes]
MKLKNSTSTQVERSFRKMAARLLHGRLLFTFQTLIKIEIFFNPGLYTGGVFMLSSNLYTDKFDDDIQKVTPARAPLAFSFSASLSNSAPMSKSFRFDLLRLRAKTALLLAACHINKCDVPRYRSRSDFTKEQQVVAVRG